MATNIPLVVYPVKDVEKAKKFFNTYLGTEPYMASDHYVGYKVGDQEVGLDPNGKAVIAYVDIDDIKASLEALKEVGGEVTTGPKDVGGGLMIAQIEVQGNTLGLRQKV